jgi:hypothetical protein
MVISAGAILSLAASLLFLARRHRLRQERMAEVADGDEECKMAGLLHEEQGELTAVSLDPDLYTHLLIQISSHIHYPRSIQLLTTVCYFLRLDPIIRPPVARSEHALPNGGIELLEKIGAGSYGQVWKAKWMGGLVAAKLFMPSHSEKLRSDRNRRPGMSATSAIEGIGYDSTVS